MPLPAHKSIAAIFGSLPPSEYLIKRARLLGAHALIDGLDDEFELAARKSHGDYVPGLDAIRRLDHPTVDGDLPARAGVGRDGASFEYPGYFKKFIYSHDRKNYSTS